MFGRRLFRLGPGNVRCLQPTRSLRIRNQSRSLSLMRAMQVKAPLVLRARNGLGCDRPAQPQSRWRSPKACVRLSRDRRRGGWWRISLAGVLTWRLAILERRALGLSSPTQFGRTSALRAPELERTTEHDRDGCVARPDAELKSRRSSHDDNS